MNTESALARHEAEAAQTDRAWERAAAQRPRYVSDWIQSTDELREVLHELVDDPEVIAHWKRICDPHNTVPVITESVIRLIALTKEQADRYAGDSLVERAAQEYMEDRA